MYSQKKWKDGTENITVTPNALMVRRAFGTFNTFSLTHRPSRAGQNPQADEAAREEDVERERRGKGKKCY